MKTELTDRQTMEAVRLIYIRRKNKDRTYSMEELATGIGTSRPTLYAALMNKVASRKTIGLLQKYLADGQGDG